MARYIDADKLKERLLVISVVSDDLYGMGINRGLDRAETAIDMMPTADVVPKSEVEEMMIGKANSLCAKFLIDEQEGRGKALMAEHDRELARGIFEEIEKYILENCCVVDDDVDIIWKHITELKKKYTE